MGTSWDQDEHHGLACFQVLLEPRMALPLQTPTAAGTRRCTRGFGRRGGIPSLGHFPLVTGQVTEGTLQRVSREFENRKI